MILTAEENEALFNVIAEWLEERYDVCEEGGLEIEQSLLRKLRMPNREKVLRGFRKWLEATLGMNGVSWDWDNMREHEQARFGNKETFDEVVKFAQGRPSIIDAPA